MEQQAHGSKEGCTAVEPPADQGDDAEALREEEQFPAESRCEGGCAADGASDGVVVVVVGKRGMRKII